MARGSDLGIALLVGGGGFLAYKIMSAKAGTTTTPTPTSNAQTAPVATASDPAPGRSPSDPRGIRNNNPGNIVFNSANNWVGQIGSDGTFVKFDNFNNGLRAAFILLRNYCLVNQLCTITKVIAKWAPAPVNNPAAYAATVASRTGIAVGATFDVNNSTQMIKIMRGIISVENGGANWYNYFSDAVMLAAYNASKPSY